MLPSVRINHSFSQRGEQPTYLSAEVNVKTPKGWLPEALATLIPRV